MVALIHGEHIDADTVFAGERSRIMRLCAHLTGDTDAAEDLAQETLSEAWRNRHTLRDPERRVQWLTGIARNVCHRWARDRFLHSTVRPRADDAESGAFLSAEPVDDFDVEVMLEQAELATLLDHALALLPPVTRAVLIARYIVESPHAEIAARLGMNEGAVKVRIQRGRLALRRVLMTDFPDEVAAYGFAEVQKTEWQETRIWCPMCGQCRLVGRFTSSGPHAEMSLRCPTCNTDSEFGYVISNANCGDADRILGGVKGFKPAITRTQMWMHRYYRNALAHRVAACPHCGQMNPLQIGMASPGSIWLHRDWRFRLRCGRCSWVSTLNFAGSILALPETQQFWRQHPRMRMLPERAMEVDGQAASITRIESVTDSARLEVISACDTYAILRIHGTGYA
ncbi:MAG: RNA polymerase sigma factor [Chloroflexota bacterium]|nr:RNA polymerase sigma factor [Chloroflexota bacterium]